MFILKIGNSILKIQKDDLKYIKKLVVYSKFGKYEIPTLLYSNYKVIDIKQMHMELLLKLEKTGIDPHSLTHNYSSERFSRKGKKTLGLNRMEYFLKSFDEKDRSIFIKTKAEDLISVLILAAYLKCNAASIIGLYLRIKHIPENVTPKEVREIIGAIEVTEEYSQAKIKQENAYEEEEEEEEKLVVKKIVKIEKFKEIKIREDIIRERKEFERSVERKKQRRAKQLGMKYN